MWARDFATAFRQTAAEELGIPVERFTGD